MDLCAEFERVVTEMDWEDVLSTLREVVGELPEETANPPPPSPPPVPEYDGRIPLEAAVNLFTQADNSQIEVTIRELMGDEPNPPSPPPVPAGLMGFESSYLNSQADDSQIEAVIREILGDAPNPSPPSPPPPLVPALQQNVTQSGHLNRQGGVYSQGQYNGVPVVGIPECMAQNLAPIGVLNGEVVYRVAGDPFAPSYSVAPPQNILMSKKRKRDNQMDEDRLYVKKPPNAFMLFRKEQRPNVVAELNLKDSAAVNTILGQRWKSLTNEEKAKYYEEADKERLLHSQRHPDWSSRDNYGKKRKRNRSKAPTNTEASASTPGEVTQQAKKLCVNPVETVMMVPSTSQMGVTTPSTSQPAVMQPHHTQTPVTLPVCNMCHLPQVYEIYWPGSPMTASTALVSPAAPTDTQTSESSHLF